MTIEQALTDLLKNERFMEDQRKDAKLRMFVSRLRNGHVGTGSAVDMLIKYGYKIEVSRKYKKVTA